jgi:hypothetical protein
MRFLACLLLLCSCASYKATLTDSEGRTRTCEASGHNGLITGSYVKSAFEDCMAQARADGFR